MKTFKKIGLYLLLLATGQTALHAATDFTEQEKALFQDLQTVTNKDNARAFLARRGITVNNVGATGVTLAFQLNQAIQEALNDNEKIANERLAEAQKNLNTLQRSTDDPFAGIITQRIINLAKNQVQAALQLKADEKLAQQLQQEEFAAKIRQQKAQAERNAAAAKVAQDEANQKRADIEKAAEEAARSSEVIVKNNIKELEGKIQQSKSDYFDTDLITLITQFHNKKGDIINTAFPYFYSKYLLEHNYPFINTASELTVNNTYKELKKQQQEFLNNIFHAISKKLKDVAKQIEAQQSAPKKTTEQLDAEKVLAATIDRVEEATKKKAQAATDLKAIEDFWKPHGFTGQYNVFTGLLGMLATTAGWNPSRPQGIIRWLSEQSAKYMRQASRGEWSDTLPTPGLTGKDRVNKLYELEERINKDLNRAKELEAIIKQ